MGYDYDAIPSKPEKKIGTERKLRGTIIIDHDYDFEIVNHLTTALGFDVETEWVQKSIYDGELRIKVYETVKRESTEGRPSPR